MNAENQELPSEIMKLLRVEKSLSSKS